MSKEIKNKERRRNKINKQSFLDNLTTRTSKRGGNNVIDWELNIGKEITVVYDDFLYKFIIYSYNSDSDKVVLVDSKGYKKEILTNSLIYGCIGRIIGSHTKDFKSQVGDIFSDNKRDIIIIDREYRMIEHNGREQGWKYYKYHCNKCENEDWLIESALLGKRKTGCNACCRSSRKITDKNCLAALRPDLIKYLLNEKQAKYIHSSSSEVIDCKCPDCGEVRKIAVNTLSGRGFNCSHCSDGISYPNKLITNILKQMNINFTREYSPKYLGRKSSDVFLKDYNVVIEMDGRLGHDGGVSFTNDEDELLLRVECDKWKDEQHLLHGVKTIRIQCFNPTLSYIKTNIMNSDLKNYLNFENIDWELADRESQKNIIKQSAELFNSGMNTKEIGKEIFVHSATATKYLHKATELGWCKYDSDTRKPIEMFKNGISVDVYISATELDHISMDYFGVKLNHKGVSATLTGKQKQYKGYTFRYITKEEYEQRKSQSA